MSVIREYCFVPKVFERWLQTRQKKQKIQPSQIYKNRESFGMGKLHQEDHQAGFLCGTRSREGDGAFPSGFGILLVAFLLKKSDKKETLSVKGVIKTQFRGNAHTHTGYLT
jgi:hypothetical protein